MTIVCTLIFAWSLQRLKSFPSNWNLRANPISPSQKVSVSIAENIMLSRWGPLLLDTICHWEWHTKVMTLSRWFNLHDLPQPIVPDSTKGFCQVYKHSVEADILFLTLLLQLSWSKYHIHCSKALTESALTLWQQVFLQVLILDGLAGFWTVLSWNGKQGDACVIIAILLLSFPFVTVNNWCIFEFPWDFFLVPHGPVHLGEIPNE